MLQNVCGTLDHCFITTNSIDKEGCILQIYFCVIFCAKRGTTLRLISHLAPLGHCALSLAARRTHNFQHKIRIYVFDLKKNYILMLIINNIRQNLVCKCLIGQHVSTLLICHLQANHWPGSSVGMATDYRLEGPGSNPGDDEKFCSSRPALGPTQPPVKWVPCLSRG